MPHRNLGRNSSQRRALLRNMTTSVLKYGQSETTEAKAKGHSKQKRISSSMKNA